MAAGRMRRPLLVFVWRPGRRWPLRKVQPGLRDSGSIWPTAEGRRRLVGPETEAEVTEDLPGRRERRRNWPTPSHSHGNLVPKLRTGAEL